MTDEQRQRLLQKFDDCLKATHVEEPAPDDEFILRMVHSDEELLDLMKTVSSYEPGHSVAWYAADTNGDLAHYSQLSAVIAEIMGDPKEEKEEK